MKRSIYHLFEILILFLCSLASTYEILESNYIYIKINGYIYFCSTIPDVSVMENGKWRHIQSLPYKGIYYLDNEYVGYGWCD
jgi:hypothetical protein